MLARIAFMSLTVAGSAALHGSAQGGDRDARPYYELQASAHDPSRRFQYDAADGGTKRRTPAVNFRGEDDVLDAAKRAKVQANARDICRNFAIANWAIRRHLDYTSTFDFHAKTGDDGFDRELEDFVWENSKAFNFDVAGRHGWESAVRMLEAQAIVTGDNGLVVLSDGRFQGLEGDRVRNSSELQNLKGEWVQGIKVDDAGRALAFAVHRRRRGGGFEFERTVNAGNVIWHGYYDRWDQVRGISPIVSALNPLRDVYENFDYALMKAKVSQLFAMAIMRKANESAGDISGGIGDDAEPKRSAYQVDFGKGPVFLDMDPGDEAKFLESQHPSSQFQDFTQLVTMVALKALDIPYSFYDEAHTNFFGSRGSWLHYERSAFIKRRNLANIQDRMLIRRLQIAIVNEELTLPSGRTIADLDWEFVAKGMPWWKPSEEINGDCQAVGAGFDNPERICRARGTGDVYDNIRRTARVIDFAEKHGVPLNFLPQPYQLSVVQANSSGDVDA